MRHAAFVFLGEDLKLCAQGVELCVHQSESATICQHYSTLLWLPADDGQRATIMEAHMEESGTSGGDSEPQLSELTEAKAIADTTDNGEVKAFFLNFYQSHVVVGTAGSDNDMLLTLVCPGYDEALKTQAERIVKALNSPTFRCTIDIILLAPDLAKVFVPDADRVADIDNNILKHNAATKQIASELTALRREQVILRHVMLIQNCNEGGVALNLDIATLARILAEYAVTTVENYPALFNQAVDLNEADKLATFGLSCLDFDRDYFVHYLLHKAYLKIMERENVTQTEVDVNKVSDLANKCLEGHVKVASDFYDHEVAPQLRDGKTPEQIVNAIRPKLNAFIADLSRRMTSYISDDELSLPEKRAVLAQILVADDELLVGNLYNPNRLTFLDLLQEPVDYFVGANNRSVRFQYDDDGNRVYGDDGKPIVLHSVLDRPQDEDGYIANPLAALKKLRIKIREASEFIRAKEAELEQIKQLEDEERKRDLVVTDVKDGFDASQYRLIAHVTEHPLEEDYQPDNITAEKSIDLSPDFTEVKDQGEIGSCSVFAVTSIFEYILKKNHKSDFDLSERFVYYNVRKDQEALDQEGSALSDVITDMGKHGICLERECPYSEEHYNEKPTDEAYADAMKRTIVKALNIPLGEDVNANINLLRTAVAEGYPVAFGMQIFKSFHQSDGFVPMPGNDDESEGNHAMVICGYDDDAMLFKVRNSWGMLFGQDGYCFIPYAYIGQRQYVNAAYIITEISMADTIVKGIVEKHVIAFDKTDNIIKKAIISSLIADKRLHQKQLELVYRAEYADFTYLVTKLSDNTVRQAIQQDEEQRLRGAQSLAQQRLSELTANMGDKLDAFHADTKNTIIGMTVMSLFFFLVAAVCYLGFDYKGTAMWVFFILGILMALGILGYSVGRKREYRQYKDRLDEELANQARIVGDFNRRISVLKVRMFTYGMVLSSLSQLHNNLSSLSNSLKSYVNNLSVWCRQEQECIEQMQGQEHVPFISLCDNGVLDKFFDQHAEELTQDIRLCECMQRGQYTLDEKQIVKFRQGLRQTIKDRIGAYLNGFTMYNYINAKTVYPYLRDDLADLKSLLQNTMQPYSRVFLQLVNEGTPYINIFVRYDQSEKTNWPNLCMKLCGESPSCGVTNSSDKLVVVQLEYVKPDNIAIFTQG